MRFNGEARDEHCDSCSTAIPITIVGPARSRWRPRRARRLDSTNTDQVTGSNLACVRDHNQLLVLHAIRTRGASTRRELSKLTGLTFQTIENISRRLIEAGILEDVPPPDDRPRTSTGPATGWCVRGRHRGGAGRMPGRAVRPRGSHPRRAAACPVCRLRLVARRAGADGAGPDRRCGGADHHRCCCWPGCANGSRCDGAKVTGLRRGALSGRANGCATSLERRLQMPVLCTSAVIAAARGEQWSGRISSRDFVYVHLASEIGCAVVSHGQLCTGARGRGGDIAHTPAVINGELCECGRRGCLQTVLAEQALRRAIATALAAPEPPTLEEISRRAASDADAAEVLEGVATHLADTLLPAVQLLDPEIVMIGGPIADALGVSILRRSGTTRCRPRRRRAWAGHPVRSAWGGRGSERGARGPLRDADACHGPPHPRYGGRVVLSAGGQPGRAHNQPDYGAAQRAVRAADGSRTTRPRMPAPAI